MHVPHIALLSNTSVPFLKHTFMPSLDIAVVLYHWWKETLHSPRYNVHASFLLPWNGPCSIMCK